MPGMFASAGLFLGKERELLGFRFLSRKGYRYMEGLHRWLDAALL